jgi:hypothetical protein
MSAARSPTADPDRCPACGAPHPGAREQIARRDEDFDYYWGGVRIPLWIALILNVPRRQQFDILLIGFMIGLIVAALAVLWGLMLGGY